MKGSEVKLLRFASNAYKDHLENHNKHGEDFNLLSLLNMERKEVGTHSILIHSLLNKNEKHGQGSEFLRLFMLHVLNIENDNPNNCVVKREDLTAEQRRIDFTIETPFELIGIEMKIDASDQKNQLNDYYNELITRTTHTDKKVKIFYLTPEGTEPSKFSLNTLNSDRVNLISFSEHILTWLAECQKITGLKPIVHSSIVQYETAIQSLFGYQRSLTMNISNEIITSSENISAALSLEKSIREAKIQLQTQLWKLLIEKLTAKKKKVEIYKASSANDLAKRYYCNSKNNRHIGLRYPINNELWCYINLYSWLHYGVRKLDDEKNILNITSDEKYKLTHGLVEGNAVANKHNDWVICYYNNEGITSPLIFSGNLEEEAETLSLLADDKKMESEVSKILEHLDKIESHILDQLK